MLEELVIDYEVNTTLHIYGHKQRICLDVMRLADYDIILGIPWLREHNLQIDWITQTLSWKNCESTTSSKPTHWQRSIVDEKTI
jgi:hypothetical protein